VKNITVVDKGFVGTGQTGQCCGLVRTFYNSPEMAYMAFESMKYIKELCDSNPSLKYETKGLLVINSIQQAQDMRENIEMLKTLGIRARYLDSSEVKRSFPLFETEGICAGFDEDAGYVNPQKIVNFLAELCKKEGVRIFEGTEVMGLERDGAGFRVATSPGEIFAEKLFNATTAYSNSINSFLGVRLEVKAIGINNAFYRVPLSLSRAQVAIVDFVNLFYMIPHESFLCCWNRQQ
jgi:sarcosine oxidase subunit beta